MSLDGLGRRRSRRVLGVPKLETAPAARQASRRMFWPLPIAAVASRIRDITSALLSPERHRKLAVITTTVVVIMSIAVTILPSKPAYAAALTVAKDSSNVKESDGGNCAGAWANTDTSIASGSLPSGTYMVLWGAQANNSGANDQARVRLVRGSTEIAMLAAEGTASFGSLVGSGWGGYWLGTLSGSEALTIQMSTTGCGTVTYVRGKHLTAIRLDTDLTADTHYFTSGSQESSSDEVTDATTASFTNVKSLTKTFDANTTQDYLVFGSMEVGPDSTTNDCNARMVVDGTAQTTATREGEDTADMFSYVFARKLSLGTGSKTISLEGQSVGSATCDFRRSRVYVFRAATFDQVAETYDASESTNNTATYNDKVSLTYTPAQTENVVMIGNYHLGVSTAGTVNTRLRNTTDTVDFALDIGATPNNVTPDYWSVMSGGSENIAAAKTYKVQFSRGAGTGNAKIKEASILVWSLTLAPQYTQSAYRWYTNADSVQPGSAKEPENTTGLIACGDPPVRLRMTASVGLTNVPVSMDAFKLQFGTSTSGPWTDVGASGSGTTWRFHNNGTPASGTIITTALLGGTPVKETYEEANPTAVNPTAINIGQRGEWDFALDPVNAGENTYYFRMVKSDGIPFEAYTVYPTMVISNQVPTDRVTRHGTWFDSEVEQPFSCGWMNPAP